MSVRFFILLVCCSLATGSLKAYAEIPPVAPSAQHELTLAEKMALARQFVSRLAPKLAEADRMIAQKTENNAEKIRTFPEGEELLLNIRLAKRLTLPSSILTRSKKERG